MDQDLALEKYMTITEVSIALGVSTDLIQKRVRELFPDKMQSRKKTYLSEFEVTQIKLRIQENSSLVTTGDDRHQMPETTMEQDVAVLRGYEIMLKRTGHLERENAEQQKLIEHQSAKIAEQRPKAEFYDRVTQSDDTYDIGEVAKMLNIPMVGRNNLFKILRGMGLLMNTNRPYQRYVDRGYFKLVQAETHLGTMPKVVVYQRGIEYIMRKLEEMG